MKDFIPHMRWLIRRDLPEVLEIESKAYAFPWTEDDFIRYLRQRHCIGMVLELACARCDDRCNHSLVIGFMVYALCETRIHVVSLAVHPERQRQGYGRLMADRLKDKLSPQRRTRLTTLVAEPNLTGQLFWRAMGLRAVGVVANEWDAPGDWANAIDMRYRIPVEVAIVTEVIK